MDTDIERLKYLKKIYKYRLVTQKELDDLIKSTILPMLTSSLKCCRQSDLYRGHPRRVKNQISSMLFYVASNRLDQNPPLIKKKAGKTNELIVKNKTKLKQKISDYQELRQADIQMLELTIRNLERKISKQCTQEHTANESVFYGREWGMTEADYFEADILHIDKLSKKTKSQMLTDLRNLVEILGFIPDQYSSNIFGILDNIPEKKRNEAISLMKDMHSFDQYKLTFGSYFKALVEAGILDEGARRETFGTRCIAEDGHECLSLGELHIDNWLFRNGIPHKREVEYPGDKSYRADWGVNRYIIEYWGLNPSLTIG